MSERLLFLHIPKSGGQSVHEAINQIFGTDHVALYKPAVRGAMRISDLRSSAATPITAPDRHLLIKAALDKTGLRKMARHMAIRVNVRAMKQIALPLGELPGDIYATYGHFDSQAGEEIFENQPLVTIAREPMERVVSLYKHWRRDMGDQDWANTTPRFNARLSLGKFMETESVIGSQDYFLRHKPVEAFSFLGTTDDLQSVVDQIFVYARERGQTCLQDSPRVSRINSNPDKSTPTSALAPNLFREIYQADYTFYERIQATKVRG